MVDVLSTKCGSCRLLQDSTDFAGKNGGFSCPRNEYIPKDVERFWAVHCNLYERGVPQKTNVVKEKTVFFTQWFAVNVNKDYKTVKIVARNGYKLQITPESSPEKILVVALEKEEV
jgi:G:T-mismatch repair DNA endonuclease (very short patch repair protein)